MTPGLSNGVKISQRVSHLKPSAVNRTLQKVRAAEAKGAKLISFLRGEPDFPTPRHIIEAARAALQGGKTHYPPNQGVLELRQSVADKMEKINKIKCDPDKEIIITTGATMGFFIAVAATCEPGDEVLLPEPIYDVYASQIAMAGATPVFVRADRQGDRFVLSPEALKKACTPKTRGILINTPWNPVGTVITRSEMKAIADLAVSRDLVIYSDEIYEAIVYDKAEHVSFASLGADVRARTITINSMSKSYAMTGWRVGYNVAPPELTQAMFLIYQQMSRGAAIFAQYGGVAALAGLQSCVTDMVKEYSARRKLIGSFTLPKANILMPEGGFFVLIDITPTGRTSEQVADGLLNEAGVVVMDASAYGAPTSGLLRLSFATSRENIQAGMAKISDWLGKAQ